MLKNKIALVTGGGKGIGAAIAKEMASQGATVTAALRKQQRKYSQKSGRMEEKQIFFAVMFRNITVSKQ